TWVGAAAGEMETGWHFLDERPMALLAGLLDSGGAGVSLLEWSAAVGVSVFHRYSRAIGDGSFLDVALGLPGADLGDRLDTAASAFAAFGVGELPACAREAAAAAPAGDLALAVRLRGDRVERVGLVIGDLAADAVAALCRGAGLDLD